MRQSLIINFVFVYQVFSQSELEVVANLCKKHDVLCVSDEVYEWLVYKETKVIKIGK